jgi:hypothetical protein
VRNKIVWFARESSKAKTFECGLNLQKTKEVKRSGGEETTTIRFGCKEESRPLDQCQTNKGSTKKKNKSLALDLSVEGR